VLSWAYVAAFFIQANFLPFPDSVESTSQSKKKLEVADSIQYDRVRFCILGVVSPGHTALLPVLASYAWPGLEPR